MKTYLLNRWDALRTSYWFIPSVFAVGAILLSVLMPMLDAWIQESAFHLPKWIQTTSQAARTTLSAMAAAIVGVTGTVFSITVVTLSLTSQQFGPRLLRRFMYDLTTKFTLGVFLSTGFYCLLILRGVEGGDREMVAPHLSVLTAVALGVLSMAMLIVFIHHVAILIQAPQVVAAVARDLDDAIVRLFPEKIGEPAGDDAFRDEIGRGQEAQLGENYVTVRSTHDGYIQAINGDGLLQWACEHDLVIRLRSRPGDFIASGSPIADVWAVGNPAVGERSLDELIEPLNEAILVGIRRTPRQDVECAIEELVEVAVRSLSPGINDPFTAMTCIDRLGASLGRFAERKLPTAYRGDDQGRLRIVARPVSFPAVLEASFNQIRQYGRDSVAVTLRLLEALSSIAEHVQRADDRKAICLHAAMVARAGDSFAEDYDRREVADRLASIEESLGTLVRPEMD